MKKTPHLRLGLTATAAVLVMAALVHAFVTGRPAVTLPAQTTQIAVMNPGRVAAQAYVTYFGIAGTCAGRTIADAKGPQAILPGSMFLFDQSQAGKSGLEPGCNASAVVSITRGVAVAAVLDIQTADTNAAVVGAGAYQAVNAAQGHRQMVFPLWHTRHFQDGWTTLIQAMNVNDTAAKRVALSVQDEKGNAIQCRARPCIAALDPFEGASWWPPELSGLDGVDNVTGRASVVGDVPIAAVAEELSVGNDTDLALYNGYAGSAPRAKQATASKLPLAMRDFVSGSSGGMDGAGLSTLLLQNASPAESADLAAEFYKQTGGQPVTFRVPGLAPGDVASIALADRAVLSNGAYAVHVDSDHAHHALLQTAWSKTGGLALDQDSPVGTELLVPYVVKKYHNQSSFVTVLNTDLKGKIAVDLELTAMGARTPILTTNMSVPAGTSSTVDFALDPLLANLPGEFVGALRVTAATSIAVQAFVNFEGNSPAVASFEGIPVDDAADTLFAPLVHSGWRQDLPAQPPTDTPEPTNTPSPTSRATTTPTDTPLPASSTPTPAPSASPTSSPSPQVVPSDTPTRSTAEGTATDTPAPEVTLTAVREPARVTPSSTPWPTLDARGGWRRPFPQDLFAPGDRVRFMVVAKDGTLWIRIQKAAGGPDQVAGARPNGQVETFVSLKAMIEKDLAEVRRQGTMPNFWAMDQAGRPWVGPQYFDGQAWRAVAADEAQMGGGLTYEARVLMDRANHAWVPMRGEPGCEFSPDCNTLTLRNFDTAGKLLSAFTVPDAPEAGRFGVSEVEFMSSAGAGALTKAASTGGTNTGGPNTGGPNTAGPNTRLAASVDSSDWAVTRSALYHMPDMRAIPYPFLAGTGSPPAGRLQNAGYFTAVTRRPSDAALQVFTWIERHLGSGASREIFYNTYVNTWLGTDWGTPEDLSDGPLFPDGVAFERIVAAAYSPSGTLWVGTASGKVASRKFGRWDAYFSATKGDPLPPDEAITGITVGPDGQVYFASAQGVLCYREGESGLRPPRIFAPRVFQKR